MSMTNFTIPSLPMAEESSPEATYGSFPCRHLRRNGSSLARKTTRGASERSLWSPPLSHFELSSLQDEPVPEDITKNFHWDGDRLLSVHTFPNSHSLTRRGAEFVRNCLADQNLVNIVYIWGFDRPGLSSGPLKQLLWEYCDKRSLFDIIRKSPLGVEEDLIWHVLNGLLKAVRHLHRGVSDVGDRLGPSKLRQPVIHNAINPENVGFQGHNVDACGRTPSPFGVHEDGRGQWPLIKLRGFSKATLLQSGTLTTHSEDFPDTDYHNLTYYEPPEYTWGYRFRPDQGKGDIWSIATCAVAMMGQGLDKDAKPVYTSSAWNKKEAKEKFYLETLLRSKDRSWIGWRATELNHKYSKLLRDFLESLLVINPSSRPDAARALVEFEARWKLWRTHMEDKGCLPKPYDIPSDRITISNPTEPEFTTPSDTSSPQKCQASPYTPGQRIAPIANNILSAKRIKLLPSPPQTPLNVSPYPARFPSYTHMSPLHPRRKILQPAATDAERNRRFLRLSEKFAEEAAQERQQRE